MKTLFCVVCLFLSGCYSYMIVHPAPNSYKDLSEAICTTNPLPPFVDLIAAVAGGFGAVNYLGKTTGQEKVDNAMSYTVSSAVVSLVSLASSVYGFTNVSRCSRQKSKYDKFKIDEQLRLNNEERTKTEEINKILEYMQKEQNDKKLELKNRLDEQFKKQKELQP